MELGLLPPTGADVCAGVRKSAAVPVPDVLQYVKYEEQTCYAFLASLLISGTVAPCNKRHSVAVHFLHGENDVQAAWICRIVAAVILLQTLFFRFSAAPESVYIFAKVGIEPWGRSGSRIAELIAAVLLFVPGRTWLGAGLAMAVIGGAIVSHLTLLGIEVQGDHGLLFGLAVVVAVCSAVLLFVYRRSIPIVGNMLLK